MSTRASVRTIFDQIHYTLSLGKTSTLLLSDDEISCYLFEECEIGVITFLHDSCLEEMNKSGVIDRCLVSDCHEIRRRWMELSQRRQTIDEIRQSKDWKTLLHNMEEAFAKLERLGGID